MAKSERKIFFRADGSSIMGLGHIIRSLALADMMGETFHTAFATKNDSAFIREQIVEACDEYYLIKNEEDFKELLKGDEIAVLDGYHFDSEFQQTIRNRVSRLVAIDDKAEIHFVADLIINPSGDLIQQKYKKEIYTKLAIGFQYALLRKDFLAAAKKLRSVSHVDTAFICMGGADPFNITVKVLEACAQSRNIKKIFVVSGSSYRNQTKLLETIDKVRGASEIVHEQSISAKRMVELISESQVAICPSSSIALEACCAKVGLLTGIFVDNQQHTQQLLINAGCCLSLGDLNTATIDDIKSKVDFLAESKVVNQMIEKQAAAIDGLSGVRLLKEFKLLAEC